MFSFLLLFKILICRGGGGGGRCKAVRRVSLFEPLSVLFHLKPIITCPTLPLITSDTPHRSLLYKICLVICLPPPPLPTLLNSPSSPSSATLPPTLPCLVSLTPRRNKCRRLFLLVNQSCVSIRVRVRDIKPTMELSESCCLYEKRSASPPSVLFPPPSVQRT